MAELPTELWLRIADFIPTETLVGLVGVNKLFFELALDCRYREVRITLYHSKVVTRLRDPIVAIRVRILRLEARELAVDDGDSDRYKLGLMNRMLSTFRPQKTAVGDVAQSVAQVLPGLINLTSLELDTIQLPPDYNFQPVLHSAWAANSFGPKLLHLSLRGYLESMRAVALSQPVLTSLQSLELEFTDSPFVMMSQFFPRPVLVNEIAPFINSLAPTLQSLTIYSWSSIDLSPFFSQLSMFPFLTYFRIRAAFDKALHEDASGLERFLVNHGGSLTTLILRLNPSGSALDPTNEESYSTFLKSSITPQCSFRSLRHLEMYPTTLSSGFEAFVAALQQCAGSLAELVLRDRYLLDEEVRQVIRTLAPEPNVILRRLKLNVRVLGIELLDLLAVELPELDTFTLFIGHVADDFQQEIQSRKYDNWKLRDLDFWRGGAELDNDICLLIANAVPTIQSFWGTGNMLPSY